MIGLFNPTEESSAKLAQIQSGLAETRLVNCFNWLIFNESVVARE